MTKPEIVKKYLSKERHSFKYVFFAIVFLALVIGSVESYFPTLISHGFFRAQTLTAYPLHYVIPLIWTILFVLSVYIGFRHFKALRHMYTKHADDPKLQHVMFRGREDD